MVPVFCQFNTCCVFNDVSLASKPTVLGFYLDGIAKSYFDDIVGVNRDIKFSDLVEGLQAKLGASQGSYQAELEIWSTKQKLGKTVNSYFDRLRKNKAPAIWLICMLIWG